MKSEHPCSRPVIWSRRWSWCKSASYDYTVQFQTKQHEWSRLHYSKHPLPLSQMMRKILDDFRGCQMTGATVLYTLNSRIQLPKRQLAIRRVLPEGWCRGVLTRPLKIPALFELGIDTCHIQITAPGFTHICGSLDKIMRRIKTFRSTADRIYDGSPVRL